MFISLVCSLNITGYEHTQARNLSLLLFCLSLAVFYVRQKLGLWSNCFQKIVLYTKTQGLLFKSFVSGNHFLRSPLKMLKWKASKPKQTLHTDYSVWAWRQHTGRAGLLKLNITMVRAGYFQTWMQELGGFFFLFLWDERNSWGFINKGTFKTLLTAPRKMLLYYFDCLQPQTHTKTSGFHNWHDN